MTHQDSGKGSDPQRGSAAAKDQGLRTKDLLAIAPGTVLPDWVRALDAAVFGEAWGPLAAHERVWGLEGAAFARWACVPAAGEAELLRIAVDPGRRGQGLGRRLLEGCMAALAAEGMTELHLEVRAGNAAARALYGACGWREVGRRARYYADGEDAVLCGRQG